jgi:hypothetical protein
MADWIRTPLKLLQGRTKSDTHQRPHTGEPQTWTTHRSKTTFSLRNPHYTYNLRARISIKASVQTQCRTCSTPTHIGIIELKKPDDHKYLARKEALRQNRLEAPARGSQGVTN